MSLRGLSLLSYCHHNPGSYWIRPSFHFPFLQATSPTCHISHPQSKLQLFSTIPLYTPYKALTLKINRCSFLTFLSIWIVVLDNTPWSMWDWTAHFGVKHIVMVHPRAIHSPNGSIIQLGISIYSWINLSLIYYNEIYTQVLQVGDLLMRVYGMWNSTS